MPKIHFLAFDFGFSRSISVSRIRFLALPSDFGLGQALTGLRVASRDCGSPRTQLSLVAVYPRSVPDIP
eukprot:3641595-Rhodomonas_salina.1